MNKSIEYAVYTVGGLALFCAAFLGFAKVQGVPLHSLPLLGSLFSAPEQPAGQTDDPLTVVPEALTAVQSPTGSATMQVQEESPRRPSRELRAGLNVLSAFTMEAPYTASELQELVARLLELEQDYQRRLESIEDREALVDERMAALETQAQSLQHMRDEIAGAKQELESAREKAVTSGDEDSSSELAKLFLEGDATSLTARLLSFQPAQAAQILRHLEETRAAELLNALEPAKWQEYARAYSKAPALQR